MNNYLTLLIILIHQSECHHHGGNGGSGGPDDSNNNGNNGPHLGTNNGPTSANSWTPEKLDCSAYPNAKNNSFCDKFVESLLGVILGVPTDGPNTVPKLRDDLSKKHDQPPARSNSNVTQLCCFLLTFPSAKENCCEQISNFCDDIFGPNDVCLCPNNYGTNSVPTSGGDGNVDYGNYGDGYPNYGNNGNGGWHRRRHG